MECQTSEDCFEKLITEFLALKHPKPKEVVVDALRSPPIEKEYLVSKVEKLCFTGHSHPSPKGE